MDDPRTCDECGANLVEGEEDICSDCEEAENDYGMG